MTCYVVSEWVLPFWARALIELATWSACAVAEWLWSWGVAGTVGSLVAAFFFMMLAKACAKPLVCEPRFAKARNVASSAGRMSMQVCVALPCPDDLYHCWGCSPGHMAAGRRGQAANMVRSVVSRSRHHCWFDRACICSMYEVQSPEWPSRLGSFWTRKHYWQSSTPALTRDASTLLGPSHCWCTPRRVPKYCAVRFLPQHSVNHPLCTAFCLGRGGDGEHWSGMP